MRNEKFCVITERDVVIFSNILGLLIASIFKGCRETSVRNYLPIKMEPIDCTETLVRNYYFKLRKAMKFAVLI